MQLDNTLNHHHAKPVVEKDASRVLGQTYQLLSLTLGFSALAAAATLRFALPAPGLLLTLAGYFGLLFATTALRNSAWGLVSVFALTGFMGYSTGPLIGHYLSMANGPALVMTAMAATAVSFLTLSWYARRADAVDVTQYGGYLTVGILVAFVLGLAAIFFSLPAVSLVVAAAFVLLMSALIVYQTQAIVNGGETNYIMATVTLFVSIFNLFTSLLQILGFIGGDE